MVEITGMKMPSAQARWFKHEFGVEVPRRYDRKIVLTWSVFEALQARKLGLSTIAPIVDRPEVCSPFA
nr:DUF4224 domain-containing protein [Pandoraea sp. LA3]